MLETSNFSASLGVLTGCGNSPIRLVGDNTNKGEIRAEDYLIVTSFSSVSISFSASSFS